MAYHERWEQELAFDEIKTHLNGRPVPIRSKTPGGVTQEIYSLALAHYVVRRVMLDASAESGCDTDRLSFVGTVRVLQCHLPEAPMFSTRSWYRRLLGEVGHQVLRPLRERWHPRVIKQKMSGWMKKRAEHLRPPQPTKPFREAIVILN